MKSSHGIFFLVITLACRFAAAQGPPPVSTGGIPLKTTFVSLGQQANAILVEPVEPNKKSRIAVLITHPEREVTRVKGVIKFPTLREAKEHALRDARYAIDTGNYVGSGVRAEAYDDDLALR